ncbi:hypothetical protein GQR58_002584 [Nymphon striatum]|nr:hypothetical protein GQR58_002584 [Nymphon striatum]
MSKKPSGLKPPSKIAKATPSAQSSAATSPTDMCKLAACDNQPLSVESDDDSLDEDDLSDEEQEYGF